MSAQARARRAKSAGRTPPPAAPLDPVSHYARAVLDGTLVAGRAVRLACERHVRDLAQQRTEAFPYYFDIAAAEHIIGFFPSFLTLEDGRPFVLTDWLQFCLGSVFGWKRVTNGRRRFQVAYIETAKGSGKTPTLAGVGLYGLAFDDEASAQIFSAAFDKGQASLILNDAIRMAENSPDLREMLEIGKYNIAHAASGSFFRATSSEHRSKSGPRPHYVLIDELHEHRDATVVTKLTAGFKFRRSRCSSKSRTPAPTAPGSAGSITRSR
jgi:phage terminase large subunit-like protein